MAQTINDKTIFDTINRYMSTGATLEQAIEKVEGILHTILPQNIKDKLTEGNNVRAIK